MGHLFFKIWSYFLLMLAVNVISLYGTGALPREQSSWGQHGAHLCPVGPRWAPCWPHEPYYQGMMQILSTLWILIAIKTRISVSEVLSMHQVFPLFTWWRHQMKPFSELLALCPGNSPVTGEFPAQRPVTRSFDVFFDLHLNKQLSKQSWGWWFEMPLHPSWRHCNVGVNWLKFCVEF